MALLIFAATRFMTLQCILLFGSLFFSSIISAQEKPAPNPDRPDQTDAVYTIERGYLQLENGFFLQHREDSKTYGIADALFRLGICRNFELRLSSLLSNEKEKAIPANTGIQFSELGFKLKLLKQNKILPAVSFNSSVPLPFLISKPFKTDVQNITKFLFSNDIDKTTQLGYNTGDIIIKHEVPLWFYTISLTKELNNKLEGYIENYSFFQSGARPDFNLDGGLSYSFSDFFMPDIAAGFSVSRPQTYFITVGFTYLFPKKFF